VSALAPGFRAAAAVVRHLTGDPLLPGELLPPSWPGDDVRQRYDAYERLYRRVLQQWIAAG
jgi:DNA-binding transcriptional regulator PaaX